MTIEEALERWENSGGLACSDPYDDGTIEVLFTLAQAYINEQAVNKQLLAACKAACNALWDAYYGTGPAKYPEGIDNQLRAAIAAGKE